jgi:CRP-like cAMP-binding protein
MDLQFIKQQFEYLTHIPDSEWNEFTKILRPRKMNKGDSFIRIGEKVEKFAFIKSGLFRFYVNNSDGNEYNQAFKKENDIMATYYPLLTKCPSPMGIEALEDSEIIEASYADFIHFYERDKCWLILGRKIIELNFIIKAERELELLTMDGKTRYKKFINENEELIKRLPQFHLALHFGMNPSSFNRMVKQVEKESN